MENTHITVSGHKVSGGKTYSTSEVRTGDVWIDGKPIYRRTFTGTTGTLTNYSENSITINFDFEFPISYHGTIKAGGSNWNTFPYSYTSTASISSTNYGVINQAIMCYFSTSGSMTFAIYCSNNSSTYSNKEYYITVEYTKTTD